MSRASRLFLVLLLVAGIAASCRQTPAPPGGSGAPARPAISAFLADANATLLRLSVEAAEASWVQFSERFKVQGSWFRVHGSSFNARELLAEA